jgi:hypothetical protein
MEILLLIFVPYLLIVALFAWLALVRPRKWRRTQLATWPAAADLVGARLIEQSTNMTLVVIVTMFCWPLYTLWKRLGDQARLFSLGAELDGAEVTAIPFHMRVYDKALWRELGGMRSDNQYRTYVQADLPAGASVPALRLGPHLPVAARASDERALGPGEQALLQTVRPRLGYLMVGPRLVVLELDAIVEDPAVLAAAMKLVGRLAHGARSAAA